MNNNFDSKENHAGRDSSNSLANDRQRAVPLDVQNYTPIKGLIYFTVFTALSFSILVFALAPQLKVDDQNVNSLSGIAQPISQGITKQATPATELAETSGSVKEIKSTGEQVSVQEPVDGSASVPAPLPETSVSTLELATTESSEELTPEVGIQFSAESKIHTEAVVEVTERPAQQSEPMTPLGIELAAIVDLDTENQSLPESISDIESTVYAEETPVQQAELAVPVESVVPVEAQHVQQIERIQSELTAVAGSDKEAQQGGEPASSHNSLEHIDADSGQGFRSLQSAKTDLVQVAPVGVILQRQNESVSDTVPVARIDEESVEQPEPSVPVLEPIATELAAIVDFDAENQSLPESIYDIESTVYAEETPVQQAELAAPVESVVPVEAQHVQQIERIQSELTAVAGSEKEAQQGGEPASSHNSLEHIDADSGQGSRPLQTAKTELVQIAAVGVIQQSQLESANDTEPAARIDEESVEQPEPSVPVLEPIATELAAIVDFDAENQSLPESISDIESTVYVEETPVQQSELATLELKSLETELAQVAESMTDDRSLDELAVPVESVVQVEAQHEQQIERIQSELTAVAGSDKEAQHSGVLVSEREEQELFEIESDQISRELPLVTTQLVQAAAEGFTQQSDVKPISNTETVTRTGEKSAEQSQLAALTVFDAENQSLPESASDIELAVDVGELFEPEPAFLETEAKQVTDESVIDDQRVGEQPLPAELTVTVESETGQSSRELQPTTTQTVRATEDDIVQQNHIEPISDTELAEASESETNDEGLGGPITDYEQALQVDPQPNQQSQPDVTVLEPVSGEEKLVPTGETEPVILLSTDLESLANAPVVLTESNVRPGDTLSAIFKRNNLSYKIAQKLISAPGSKSISVLYPRDHLKFVWSNNKLLGIELRRKNKLSLMATYDGSQFTVINIREARRAGTIVKLLKQEIESVEREDLIDYETQYAKLKNADLKWSTTTVKKGDALSKIFRRAGLSAVEAIAVAGYPGNEWLATGLKPGQVMNIAKSEEGKFAILEVPEKGTAKVRLVFPVAGGYFVGFKKIKAEVQEHYACAEVESSLYSAGYAVNIPREVLDEFVSLFESRFDFSRQLQRGDQFCIIYDREYIKGKPLKAINIKAGSLIQENAELHAFRHVDDDDRVAYYDSEGLNMQGHFLRSPIKSARVVSNYSKRRYHPVLKTNRPHLGVDYGARTGTPIRSTATGQVIKRGWSGGYGKMIVIQHGSKYRTLYAHMSRYADGTSVGSYVKQGQVIGYVGSTGLSTGPHLHYEFHVNGRHRDPLQYDMPKGQPIPEQYKIAFQSVVNEFSKRLASIDVPQVEYRPSTHQTASSQ